MKYFLKMLVIGAALGFGIYQVQSWLFPVTYTTYGNYASYTGDSEVTFYGTDWCQYCASLKQYLNENNIEYDYKNVEEDDLARKEFNELGGDGYPLIVTTDRKISGFVVDEIEVMLKSNIKSPDTSH